MKVNAKDPAPDPKGITTGRRILRFFFGVMVIALLFVGSLIFIINLPPVQKRGVDYLSAQVSAVTGTAFSIGSFGLSWRGDLLMHDVLIEDLRGDTLLAAETIGARVLRDLPGLLGGSLEISDVLIQGTTFRLDRYPDGTDNVLRYVARLFPPKPDSGKPFHLAIRRVRLNDFRYVETDSISGKFLSVTSGKAEVRVRCVSFSPLDFEFSSATATGTVVDVRVFQGREPGPGDQPAPNRKTKTPYSFRFDDVELSDATFRLDNDVRSPDRTRIPGELNYDHLRVAGLDVHLRNFTFDEKHTYRSRIESGSFRESSGFEVNSFTASDVEVTRTGASLTGVRIETDQSIMGDSLFFHYADYPDFLDYNNRVIMDGRFHDCRIGIGDLFYFAPALKTSAFFQKNRDQAITMDGYIGSRVNNLKGRDVRLMIGDRFRLKGSFGSRNLAIRREESLNLKLDELVTDIRTLREIIPGFSPPANFNKLGHLNFKGRFDGFLVDFVSFGELETNLGKATLDMRMNLKKGLGQAEYSGDLGLEDFDLGTWTGNRQLGKISVQSKVRNGQGLTLENVRADVQAKVGSLQFRDYEYRNLQILGDLTKDRFNGQFDIRDENIDLIFEGFVRYRDSLPGFDFRAIINHLDLQALHFTDKPVRMSGIVDLDLQGREFNALKGTARALAVEVDREGKRKLRTDSLVVRLEGDLGPNRRMSVRSDLAIADIRGDLRVLELPGILASWFPTHFPELAARWHIGPDSIRTLASGKFSFDIEALKLNEFLKAFRDDAPSLDGTVMSGFIDRPGSSSEIHLSIPRYRQNDRAMDGLVLDFAAQGTHMDTRTTLDSITIGETTLHAIGLTASRKDGPYRIQLNIDDRYPYGTHLLGTLGVDSLGYQIQFLNDSLVFTNRAWMIAETNVMEFDSTSLVTRDMRFSSQDRLVEIKDYQRKGVILHLDGLRIGLLDRFIHDDRIRFGGQADLDILVRNLFEFRDFAAILRSDSLVINGDNYGPFLAYGAMPTLKSPLEYSLELGTQSQSLNLEGYWYADRQKDQGGEVDARFTTRDFPVRLAEYFLATGIRDTKGGFSADLHLTGPLRKPEVDGHIDVRDVATTLIYLGTRYSVPEGRIRVDSRMFDATGVILKDVLGNEARVTGGMTHDHFRDWGLDCKIESDRMLALDTRKKDNPYYYGTGIGRMSVDFSGTLKATNIYVNAVTARGSSLNIPINYSTASTEIRFVEFIAPRDSVTETVQGPTGPKGLQFEMDLILTEDALVQIIFDERAGDILSGYGRGNIRLLVPRSGVMRMYGDYTIDRGEYLFTFQNLVNKSFQVERGGTILWSGDPFEAQINLRANYDIAGTPPYNLIAEYLVVSSGTATQQARNPTEVNLVLLLTGKLLEPDIHFDLAFPELTGEIRSLVETKMQTLRRDANDMNWQVFGLIMSNNFLPSNLTTQGTQYVAGINTVSELISNQFSRYMTAMLSEFVSDVGIISGIDFDAGFTINQSDLSINQFTDAFSNTDFHLSQKVNFYDDRLSLAVKGNVRNTTGLETTRALLIGGDFQIEYALTEDRRLKVRVYQRSEPTILGNRRFKTGIGFTFRQEFD